MHKRCKTCDALMRPYAPEDWDECGSCRDESRMSDLKDQLKTERARVRVLRGQLINCVDHLSGARRKSPHVMEHILPVIEQANRVIAATAPEAGEDV